MWTRLKNKLTFVFHRDRFQRELSEELEFHRQMLERDGRDARVQFGNAVLAAEDARAMWLNRGIDALAADVRYALRQFRRAPGLALVAVLSLALGIGANTAIFTLINGCMLKPLPVLRPDELVLLVPNGGAGGKGSSSFAPAAWQRLKAEQTMFSSVAAYGATSAGDFGGAAAQRTIGLVSGAFFSTLGTRPAVGRLFSDADDQPGCPAVAVISYSFWHDRFDGRVDVLAAPLPINGVPFQIAGVTEPGFFGIEYGMSVPVWVPQCAATIFLGPGPNPGGGFVVGRLKAGVTSAESRGRLAALVPIVFPNADGGRSGGPARTIDVVTFAKGLPFLRDRYGTALFILMATVGAILLIACANLASLLLARAAARRREICVRLALGAGRGRLLRQLLTENLLLAFAGAAAGVMVGQWCSRALVAMLSDAITLDVGPDLRVLLFTAGVATLVGVAFAVLAVHSGPRHRDLVEALGARGAASGHRRFLLRKALVVLQVAMTLVLLVVAALLVGSWSRLLAIDPGFAPNGVLMAGVGAGGSGVTSDQHSAVFQQVLTRLRALPGVTSAGAAWIAPLGENARITLNAAESAAPPANDIEVRLNHVSEGYLRTIGTPLLAGRDFNERDLPSSPWVAIVNEELARRLFGRTDVVGRRLRAVQSTGNQIEIVGVAGNTKWGSLREDTQPIMYDALRQIDDPGRGMSFAMRTESRLAELAPAARAAIEGINSRFSITVYTLRERVENSVRLPRTLATLSGMFGAIALVLAVIGLYGVISYIVGRRRTEIGVRLALGAPRGTIVAMVAGETGRLIAAGILLGVGASLATTRLVSTFLYGLAPNDLSMLGACVLLLAIVAGLAGTIPAHKAARMNPVTALRED